MINNIEKGRYGEKLSIEYLISRNYTVKDINYNTRYGEIDIISIKKEILAFVEVKSRSNDIYGTPREAVNLSKQKKIIKSAYIYIQEKKLFNYQIRFDIIEIDLRNKKINHIENAFQI